MTRDVIRQLLTELEARNVIYDFFEIEKGHGWYKEDIIHFGIYHVESSYDYDCHLDIKVKNNIQEFYEVAYVYGNDQVKTLTDISQIESYIQEKYG